MPTDTARRWPDSARFALGAVAWSLVLFGLLRLSWTEARLLLPLTRMQGVLAARLFGTPSLPVEVTLACSGADAVALCLGAILAYPLAWRARLIGAGVGVVLILGLNTVRIGTLGQVAASPAWFDLLHLYVWPGALTLVIAGYVLAWMRLADRGSVADEVAGTAVEPIRPGTVQPTRRFVVLALIFMVLFVAASPLYLESGAVLGLAAFIARSAAAILATVGVGAYASANVLWTSRGGFLVTQECITTPLVPVYLAATVAYSTTGRRMAIALVAAAPLFIALGIVRLLVVALPATIVTSPLFVVHAFYQLLLGGALVFLAAQWRHGGAGPRLALLGVLGGVLFVSLLGPSYTRLVLASAAAPLNDPQGALALLPAFQIGLYMALWVAAFLALGWRPFVAGLAVLGLTQTAGLLALHALATQSGFVAHVRDVRGWAVAGPLLIIAVVANVARPRR